MRRNIFTAIWFALLIPCQAGKIHDAVAKRDLAALDRALKTEPKQVNARCYPDFDTPLYQAVALGDPAIVGRLLAAGADPGLRQLGHPGLTPLQAVQVMLHAGANQPPKPPAP